MSLDATRYKKVSFTKDQLQKLKTEAVKGRPYADRISLALAFRLLFPSKYLDPFSVLDEIDYLEGISKVSRTKKETQFSNNPLHPFWHKHFSSARHIIKNINIRWGIDNQRNGNKLLDKKIDEIFSLYENDDEKIINYLAHELTVNGYQDRLKQGLTGDWIIFSKYNQQNIYLDLATHEEAHKYGDNKIYTRLEQGCKADFPYLFSG